MQLAQDNNRSSYQITDVTQDGVYVNGDKYTHSLIVCPHQIISPWQIKTLQTLTLQDFEMLAKKSMELVLLGIGEHGGRLPVELQGRLLERKLVVECMSLAAAARTYSILSAEGRLVAAAMMVNF